jgi:hypothetical protein
MAFPPNHLNEFEIAMAKASSGGLKGTDQDDFISQVDERVASIGNPTKNQVRAAITAELSKGK